MFETFLILSYCCTNILTHESRQVNTENLQLVRYQAFAKL